MSSEQVEKIEWKEKVKFENGIYEGQMKGNVKYGFGTCQYDDGSVYSGEFKNDKKHGQGDLKLANGESYIGEFRNGEKHGIGIFRNVLGILETRVYDEGRVVSGHETSEFSKNYFEDPTKELKRRAYRKYIQQLPVSPVANKDLSGKHPRTNECPNIRAVWNFIEFKMKMNTKWFRFDHNFCFCQTCLLRGFTSAAHKTDTRGGGVYAYPFGWCKIALPVPPFFESSGSLDNWHVGFHGTRADTAKIIIEQSRGGLLMPGDVTPSGFKLPVRNPLEGKEEGWENQFFMSPSIKYCEEYVEDVEYLGDTYRIAFQVRIEPGTYFVGPATVANERVIDELFGNDKLEWFTNRRNVAVVSGLMVKRIFDGKDRGKDIIKEERNNNNKENGEKKTNEEEEEEGEAESEISENSMLKKRVGELEGIIEDLKKEIEELKMKK